ncbi:MAG: porin family protein [Bacteroidia bacterium]|nr:porin family protein [Bacteroidia bacterium]
MKKINLAIISSVVLSLAAKSQITKNNWMLGGVINYSSIHRNSENYGPSQVGYRFNINPNVGYFVADKFAVGLKAGINKDGVKPPGTSTYNKYSDFNIGPYIRYYFLNSEKMSIYFLKEYTNTDLKRVIRMTRHLKTHLSFLQDLFFILILWLEWNF